MRGDGFKQDIDGLIIVGDSTREYRLIDTTVPGMSILGAYPRRWQAEEIRRQELERRRQSKKP